MVATREKLAPGEDEQTDGAEAFSNVDSLHPDPSSSQSSSITPMPFIALIQSGRTTPPDTQVDDQAGDAQIEPPSAVEPFAQALHDPASLHPAWFDALPPTLDDLIGPPTHIVGPSGQVIAKKTEVSPHATTDLTMASEMQEGIGAGRDDKHTDIAVAVRSETIKAYGVPRRPAVRRGAFLPAGRWSGWAWLLYGATFGVPIGAALTVASAVRLFLPSTRQLWIFKTKRDAATLLGGVTSTITIAALIATAPMHGSRSNSTPPGSPTTVAVVALPAAPTTLEQGLSLASDDPILVPLSTTEMAETGVDLPAGATQSAPLSEVVEPTVVQPSLTETPVRSVPIAPAVPSVSVSRVTIANTGGRGVAYRNSPVWADRVAPKVAFREGTTLTVVEANLAGDDGAGGTTAWLKVRDSRGQIGYIPAQFARRT